MADIPLEQPAYGASADSAGSVHPGLSSAEAQLRLQQFGANALAPVTPRLAQRILAKFSAPIPWLLEVAILFQFVLREYAESAVIALLLVFNAALGLIQEGRAQATLDALQSRLALLASVRRDGRWVNLPAGELVPGDLVKLTLGAIVPADVRLLEGSVLLDQSMLTGEAMPVDAGADALTYAGALVRRGEALAEVTATGERTRFGRTAQLVRVAHANSSQQQAVLRVVRNLAFFSASAVCVQIAYGTLSGLPALEMLPLILTAVLAAIPVALPATFTLASAIGARTLADRGVLPTRLSAIDEAGTLDVLCSDKTGTLTENALRVSAMQAAPGCDEATLLALAALASAEGGMDPVDGAIRKAAESGPGLPGVRRVAFVPFDPASRSSQATITDAAGTRRIIKGAVGTLAAMVPMAAALRAAAEALQARGSRVLGVLTGPPDGLAWAGVIGLSDPPRADAPALIAQLRSLGIRTLMITGDAAATAAVVARAVGIDGAVCTLTRDGAPPDPAGCSVFAGVFPEDKFSIVQGLQKSGHVVGMCGDGANDAPALRQAQMGIAVSTATDVAKSAAGLVLTHPGLGGIVDAVRCGRQAYQRILTYVLRSVTTKINQMLFLTVGLLMTGRAILTPMLMVIVMISGDFLAMSAASDRVHPSSHPNQWRIGRITLASVVIALCTLAFCTALLYVGWRRLGLEHHGLRTLAAVTLVCSSQAVFYVVRERRRMWHSAPSRWVVLSSVADVSIIAVLAGTGTLMHALPWTLIGAIVGASVAFALVLDMLKSLLFGRLGLAEPVTTG